MRERHVMRYQAMPSACSCLTHANRILSFHFQVLGCAGLSRLHIRHAGDPVKHDYLVLLSDDHLFLQLSARMGCFAAAADPSMSNGKSVENDPLKSLDITAANPFQGSWP